MCSTEQIPVQQLRHVRRLMEGTGGEAAKAGGTAGPGGPGVGPGASTMEDAPTPEADQVVAATEDEVPEPGTHAWVQFMGEGQWMLHVQDASGTEQQATLPALIPSGQGYWQVFVEDGEWYVWQGGDTEVAAISEFIGAAGSAGGDGAGGDVPEVLPGLSHQPTMLPGMQRLPAMDPEDICFVVCTWVS